MCANSKSRMGSLTIHIECKTSPSNIEVAPAAPLAQRYSPQAFVILPVSRRSPPRVTGGGKGNVRGLSAIRHIAGIKGDGHEQPGRAITGIGEA